MDPEALQIGDIVLSTDPDSWVSWMIRVSTWGEYSHAAICTRYGLLVEATYEDQVRGGVWRCSVMRLMARERKHLRVLRLDDTVSDWSGKAKIAASRAEWMIARRYWHDGAKRFLFPGIPPNLDGAFFCSHLVALAYKHADPDLLRDLPSEKISPSGLLSSNMLKDVTDEVLVEENELDVRESLPVGSDYEGPHQSIEIPIEQALAADPRVRQLCGEPQPHGYWDVATVLARTRDPELDRFAASAIARIADGYRTAWPEHSLKSSDIRRIENALRIGAISPGRVQTELRISRGLLRILEQDIKDRKVDISQNKRISRNAPEVKTFKLRHEFAKEYLEFMKGQRSLLKSKIETLDRAALAQRVS